MRCASTAFFFSALGFICLTGCRPNDPLDWKVSANSPADYQEWRDGVASKLPADLQQEIDIALTNLAAVAPDHGQVHQFNETNNSVCLQINRRTVRTMIREGCLAASTFFQQKIAQTTDSLTHNLNSVNEPALDATARQRYEKAIDYQRKQLAWYETNLALVAKKTERFTATTP